MKGSVLNFFPFKHVHTKLDLIIGLCTLQGENINNWWIKGYLGKIEEEMQRIDVDLKGYIMHSSLSEKWDAKVPVNVMLVKVKEEIRD